MTHSSVFSMGSRIAMLFVAGATLGMGASCRPPGSSAASGPSDDLHQNALANARLLGVAMQMYLNDSDDLTPLSTASLAPFLKGTDITGFTLTAPPGVSIHAAKAGDELARKELPDGYASLIVGTTQPLHFTSKWTPKTGSK